MVFPDYNKLIELTLPLLLFVVGMVAYSVFIFKFYRFLARKDIFELNLNQYNNLDDGLFRKGLRLIFYLIEYILVFPIFVFFWFLILSALLVFLSQTPNLPTIMLTAVALVSSIRVTAYYDEDLSKDLAKMLPFALLGIFLVDISFFSFWDSFELLKSFPNFWELMLYYLIFAIVLEFVLRLLHALISLFYDED